MIAMPWLKCFLIRKLGCWLCQLSSYKSQINSAGEQMTLFFDFLDTLNFGANIHRFQDQCSVLLLGLIP